MWRIFTQGVALGYVLLPLRGVPLVSFDTPSPMNETAAPPIGICVFYVRIITNKIQFAKKIYHIYQQQHNLLAFSKTKAGRFPIFQLSYQDIYQPICQFSIENTHNRRFII